MSNFTLEELDTDVAILDDGVVIARAKSRRQAARIVAGLRFGELSSDFQREVDQCFCRDSETPCSTCLTLTRVIGHLRGLSLR